MTKRRTRKRNKKQTNNPVVDDLKSKRSLSGEILRIPAHLLYAIVGLITGTILGIVSFFVFPVLIPVYMIKERLAN
tara:strand:- start:588 stop:815 length:228 start_codon:yes stop_codon:yes gene_type:complete